MGNLNVQNLLLGRYYTGPQVVVGDRVVAVNKSVFQLK